MTLINSLLIVSLSLMQLNASNLKIWQTSGFEGFREGEFGSGGSNLYVSKNGTVQTIHRFDVNQDGYFDLLFASTHDRNHMVPAYQYRFKNRSRNDYRLFQYPGVGGYRVVSTDLNGDGLPELIIGRGDDNTSPNLNTWIYWGTKDGWNEKFHTELLTPNLRDLCVGDLNNDSKPDLIITGSSTLLIYWGQNDGFVYQNKTVFPAAHLNSCLVADVDGDSQNDLVISASNKAGKVIWGKSSGISFDDAARLPVETSLNALTLGPRLVLATPNGPAILAVRERSFSLQEEIHYPGAGRLAVSDLNGDKINDLVVTRLITNGSYNTTSRIFWGKAKNSSETYRDSSFTDLPTLGALDVAVADLDSDGFQDVLFANSRDDDSYSVPSYIYWGGARGYAADKRAELLTHGAQSVSVNGTDVLYANNVIMRRRGDADSYVYLGNKDGLYTQNSLIRLPTIGAYEGCISDLNDDGFPDVLITNSYEDSPEDKGGSPIFWGGRQGPSPATKTMVNSRTGIGCAVADLDTDGYLDLLVTNYTEDTASIFYGSSKNDYADREQILKVRDARFPAIADLNKDNHLDLIIPSVKDGLYIFWGSSDGYRQENNTRLPGVGAVSQQIADLDGDGYLDIVLCNLYDEQNRLFSGVNSFIYWGSPSGYSPIRRLDIPSFGGTHATIADYNLDGHLDIFISNYQAEYDRNLNSFIYWGNREAVYSKSNRTEIRVGSASGSVSADFNGDGWIDIAVANHFQDGSHITNSYVFWNSPQGFDDRHRTVLPTIGPHMMICVDPGDIYTRDLREIYTSTAYDAGLPVSPIQLVWEGATPHVSKLGFEIRGSESRAGLANAPWQSLGSHQESNKRIIPSTQESKRWWQYRVIFIENFAASPTLSRVSVTFRPQ